MVNKHLVADKAIEDKLSALSVWTHDKHLRLTPSPRVQAARNLKTLYSHLICLFTWKDWPNLKHALHKSSYERYLGTHGSLHLEGKNHQCKGSSHVQAVSK